MDMDTHTQSISACKSACKCKTKCLFLFPSAIAEKNKGVFSPTNKPVFKSDFGKGIW